MEEFDWHSNEKLDQESSIEEVEVVENGWRLQNQPPVLVGKREDRNSLQSSRRKGNKKVEDAFGSLRLFQDQGVSELSVHKKLHQSTDRRTQTLGKLNFEIEQTENRLASLRQRVKKPEKEDILEAAVREAFKPLSKQEEADVDQAFQASKFNRKKILSSHEKSNIEITGEVMRCLLPGGWLNDEVINLYFTLLKERENREPKMFLKCHFSNTFFYKKGGGLSHVYTVATILGCLSQAPRLPGLDWGAIVRRCMKYESQVAEMSPELVSDKGILREECLKLCLAHANEFDPLLNVLDELSDLSRFRMLELNLQSWILLHLSDLSKKFSGSRIVKLFIDVANFLSSLQSNKAFSTEQKRLLRIASWQGLCLCMDETLPDTSEYVSNMEYCMEVLFSFLPLLHSAVVQRIEEVHSVEWLAAVKCLSKARQSWLLKFLQVPDGNLAVEGKDFPEVVKKIQASARLVQRGSFPLIELAKLKAYLLNTNSDGIWGALVEIVAALQHVDANTKRQWLVDTVEISCVTTHPSTINSFDTANEPNCIFGGPRLFAPTYILSDDIYKSNVKGARNQLQDPVDNKGPQLEEAQRLKPLPEESHRGKD